MKMHAVILAVVGLGLLALGSVNAAPRVPAIFSFGDSVADVGTNTYLPSPAFLANFPPYGETYFNKPTGRFCNGRLWIDILAQTLGLPFMKAFLEPGNTYYDQGVNFASAGSGLLESTHPGHVINFPQQFKQFQEVKAALIAKKGSQATDVLLRKSIYVIASVGNDLFSYLTNITLLQTVSPMAKNAELVSAMEKSVTDLYNEGARKIIFGALSSLGCLPILRATTSDGSCNADVNGLAQLFNSYLPAARDRLARDLPGLFLVITNNYELFSNMINNGSSYGFTKGSLACCGAGPYNSAVQCGTKDAQGNNLYTLCPDSELDQYVFWDQYHPTEKTYTLLADAWMYGGKESAYPFNINALANF